MDYAACGNKLRRARLIPPIKSILLVVATSIGYAGLVTAIFRVFVVRRRIVLMCGLFLITLVFLVVVHAATPPSLGFLPATLTIPAKWVDLGFATLLYVAAFFGGILQLYNLADRGFSLRMLTDIYESPGGVLTVRAMFEQYSAGRGLEWMYQKRLDGLLDQGLILIDGDKVCNSEKGRRVALMYQWLQNFLRLRSDY